MEDTYPKLEQLTEAISNLSLKKQKKKFPIYWCIKIDPVELKDIISKIPPEDIAHLKLQEIFHITLLFNRNPPTEEIMKQYSDIVGKKINITLTGYVIDEKGGAIIVEKTFEHSDLCTNTYPHVSLGKLRYLLAC